MREEDLKSLLLSDADLRTVLTAVRDLALPDAWIAAGCIRNAIWNQLSGRPLFDPETDVDVVFFDLSASEAMAAAVQARLQNSSPAYNWEVKNQSRMHQHSPNSLPYTSSCDAISKYPETCTALAARLTEVGELEMFAPYGLDDVLAFVIRPTPHFLADSDRMALYRNRLNKKNWARKWPNLKILTH